MKITLEPVTPENYNAARALAVRPEQERFVANVIQSLADAYVYKGAEAYLGRSGDDPIGFVLLYPAKENGRRIITIVRFLVDAAHQGKGAGRAMFQATLDLIAARAPRPERIKLSVVPDNAAALSLYLSFGFAGEEMEHGERVLWRDVT